ncbi:hypothetical protein RM704_28395 [Streptomyces sp. DSM 3412]|uniref:Uncharacterized protein n=1 Tax=Streptomyces gottesmaniae TaxID=3075518 RepID=A0ABU2Z4T1_9ACTN|nr:hypothetical protein [Streptomyces sp. DSM 3412]
MTAIWLPVTAFLKTTKWLWTSAVRGTVPGFGRDSDEGGPNTAGSAGTTAPRPVRRVCSGEGVGEVGVRGAGEVVFGVRVRIGEVLGVLCVRSCGVVREVCVRSCEVAVEVCVRSREVAVEVSWRPLSVA